MGHPFGGHGRGAEALDLAVSDGSTEAVLVHVVQGERVRVTAGLKEFLDRARATRRRAVVVTTTGAAFTVHAALAAADTGLRWLAVDPRGNLFDALTGNLTVPPWTTVPSGVERLRHRHLLSGAPDRRPAPVLHLDLQLRHRADQSTRIGRSLDALSAALGVGPPRWWDTVEPLGRPWDPVELTRHLQDRMPFGERVLVEGDDGIAATIRVRRTSAGLTEHLQVCVPHVDPGAAFDRVDAALDLAFGDQLPDSCWAALGDLDEGSPPVQSFSARTPERPVLALIGPRVVHDRGLDLDRLQTEHHAVLRGRRRLPGLLVRFDPDDADPRDHFRAFLSQLVAGPSSVTPTRPGGPTS